MKKILACVMILFFIVSSAHGASQWTKTAPAGSTYIADLDTNIATTNNEALDRLLGGYRKDCTIMYGSASTLSVLPGMVAIQNAAGTVVRWRKLTSALAVTWASIDTGAEAVSTFYYVYFVADADATTFTVMISTSSTAPTGATYYRKAGYFYNDASGNITSVGNISGGDVCNQVYSIGSTDITTTATSYGDMDDMVVYFISSGRTAVLHWSGCLYNDNHGNDYVTFDVDGTDRGQGIYTGTADTESIEQVTFEYPLTLSAGLHTIKAQWKVSAGTGTNYGSTYSPRILRVEEK